MVDVNILTRLAIASTCNPRMHGKKELCVLQGTSCLWPFHACMHVGVVKHVQHLQCNIMLKLNMTWQLLQC